MKIALRSEPAGKIDYIFIAINGKEIYEEGHWDKPKLQYHCPVAGIIASSKIQFIAKLREYFETCIANGRTNFNKPFKFNS